MATSDIIRITSGIPMKDEWCLAAPVDFSLGSDEHIAIYGPNASGKSKLVDIILARHPLKSGTVAYSFHSPTRRYVCDNVKCLEFRDCYGGETDRDYYHQQRWNQWDVRDSRVLMSSGELRKYSLSKVLEGEPCVLILDSPFVGLDAASRKELDARLRAIASSGRTRLVLVLSRFDEMPDYITHVVPVKDQVVQPKMTLAEWKAGMAGQIHLGETPLSLAAVDACGNGCGLSSEKGYSAPEVVRLEKVSIRYGERTILKDLDWVVRRGERWALVGANGSGKSTLLSLVCADNPQAYACRISLFGHRRGSGESIWDIKKHIGYVSPELHRSFKRDIPAVNIVAGGLKDYHGMFTVPTGLEIGTALRWMEKLGIAGLKNRRFLSLSSGEQRLVLVARAFVRDPDLLILDEPLHGLDNANRLVVRNLIEEYCSDPDRTLIMVTHYAEELPPCIDRCLRLEKH